LFGVGAKTFHLALAVSRYGAFIDLEIEPPLMNDAEKSLIPLQAVAAEHAPRLDVVQITQLIQHKIPKGIVFHFPLLLGTP
jgi:hypothetical protein